MNHERIQSRFKIKSIDFYAFYLMMTVVIFCGFAYFLESFEFLMPLDFDEIISVWPIGRVIHESPISKMSQLLISSFLNEDHLLPVFNLIA